MRLTRLRDALALILGVALAVSVAMMVRQSRQLADWRRLLNAGLQGLRELQKAPPVVEGRTPAGENRAGLAERHATIEPLNRELSEAQASTTQLQGELSNSREQEKAPASAIEKHQMAWAQSVTTSFALVKTTVTLHEPVTVLFSIHNGLADDIHLDLGFNEVGNFAFTITGPSGATVTPAGPGQGGLGSEGAVVVAAGQTYSQNLLLNEWYEFPEPGNYKIGAKLNGTIRSKSGQSVGGPTAHELQLSVSARDPKRLGEVCQGLADKAVQSPDYATAAEATTALSYVHDPIAVRYLSKVLREGKFGDEIAITGLVRVGDHEAVRTLSENEEKADPELKAQIRGALKEIRTGFHASPAD